MREAKQCLLKFSLEQASRGFVELFIREKRRIAAMMMMIMSVKRRQRERPVEKSRSGSKGCDESAYV